MYGDSTPITEKNMETTADLCKWKLEWKLLCSLEGFGVTGLQDCSA